MKTEFNKNWVSSVQPRKQVKYRANAPNHILRKFMSASLDKKLKEKYGRNSIEVRKDDEVKIMRGKNKGKLGKVLVCDIKKTRVQVDGITKQKKSGDKVPVWFHPSNLKIIVLNDKDSRRVNKNKNKKSKEEKTNESHKKE
jgi:large subunit ribosomal protein L24